MKKPCYFKLASEVIKTIESSRTGKTKTATIEDAVMFRRQFSEKAEMAVATLAEITP